MNEETLFHEARQKPVGERTVFLDQVCGGDRTLRRRIEILLQADDNPDSLLKLQPPATTAISSLNEVPGQMIGPYKLLEQIGEGGMGVVFMAEQTHPVQRKVALKVIKPGMDSRQVIARFEAERQALAMMDHANIARVLDAGTTPDGLPYFVMELVHGLPITRYCDDNQLTLRERLELFVPVCHAIQHAHQKGIIHRDVKPSNVMITLFDDKPAPKVIDFGVAKATEQKLTERTLFTQYGTMVGTLEYMSPEQAEMSALGVDTRSDIFSLGVLLYELLTGSTPLSRKRVKEEAYAEILRIIKEEEPPKPSTRLSASGEALASISAHRQVEPAKLSKLIRGELDWIVMKTLEKDRNRRYETANGFAADVQRYLNDEPVQACPPSVRYRLRKFVRRNKRSLTMASVVALAVLLLVGSVGWMARDRAAREQENARDRAARLATTEQLAEDALQQTTLLVVQGRWPEAKAGLRRTEGLLEAGGGKEELHQQVRELRKDLDMVERLEIIRLDRSEVKDGYFDTPGADPKFAKAFREYGADVEKLEATQAAERIGARSIRVELGAALDEWSQLCRRYRPREDMTWKHILKVARNADPDPRRNQLREALERKQPKVLEELAASDQVTSLPPSTLVLLADALAATSSKEQAVALLRRARQQYPADFWINHGLARRLEEIKPHQWDEAIRYYTAAVCLRPQSPGVHVNLGRVLSERGSLDEAIAAFRDAIRLKPDYAAAHANLGSGLLAKGELDKAIACYRKAIELDPKYAATHNNLGVALTAKGELDEVIACYRMAAQLEPHNAESHYNLGFTLQTKGELDEAITCYRKAIDLDPKRVAAHNNLGVALKSKGELDEAIACYRKAIDLDPKRVAAHTNLADALYRQGKLDEAIACYREANRLDPKFDEARNDLRRALNGLAWRLAVSPDSEPSDAKHAVELAREAVELAPQEGSLWNTLGTAQYRAGDWAAAVVALEKSGELSQDGDSFGWFFLAMAHWQLDEKEEARKWFDQAVAWMEKNKPEDEELRCFREEAAKVLKIEDPSEPVPASK